MWDSDARNLFIEPSPLFISKVNHFYNTPESTNTPGVLISFTKTSTAHKK
jgi:hypothetical protein